MDDLEAMRLKAIRDAQQRTRMELLASNPAPQPPTDRERDEAHRLLAEQMVQRSLSMQVEALRRREVMKHQLIMQRQAESERAKMEEEEEASVAGGITNGAIADAAVVETGQTDAAQLYENYVPSKVTQGATHPDHVVETSTLSQLTPPDVPKGFDHRLHDAVEAETLSSMQLESVVYASMKHEQRLKGGRRAGFFLGDGPGVGKGRQIAGLVYSHARGGGSRALWISVSGDLKFDAERDLRDLGLATPRLEVYPKGNAPMPNGDLDDMTKRGVVFCTYSLLIQGSGKVADLGKEGADLETLLMKKGSRLEQLVRWLRQDPHGPLIVFDECHRAKNLVNESGMPTKTALAVVALQRAIPDARVVYCSATGASEPKNLAYMTRLHAHGFSSVEGMLNTLTESGMGALEMFALGLKATGSYLCRSLSYAGAEFELQNCELTDEMAAMYDRSCAFWQMLHNVFNTAATGRIAEGQRMEKASSVKWAQFWGAHQRFFRQMLLSAKVPHLARLALEHVHERNMAVVIGLQSTGESNVGQAMADAATQGEEVDDFVSAPAVILRNLIAKQFPITSTKSQLEADAERTRWEALYVHVYAIVRRWKQLPTVAQTADKTREEKEEKTNNPTDPDAENIDEAAAALDRVERGLKETSRLVGDHLVWETIGDRASARAVEFLLEKRNVNETTERARAELAKREDKERGERERAQLAAIAGVDVRPNPRVEEIDAAAAVPDEKLTRIDKKRGWKDDASPPQGDEKEPSDGDTPTKDVDSRKGSTDPTDANKIAATKRRKRGEESDSSNDGPVQCQADPTANLPIYERLPPAPRIGLSDEDSLISEEDERSRSPSPTRGDDAEKQQQGVGDAANEILVRNPYLVHIRDLLLEATESLQLPPNPLDHLVDLCGGPSKVAEMTGRERRLVRCLETGNVEAKLRRSQLDTTQKLLNMAERESFQSGEKLIAIISEAASTGVSLQADKRVKNQRRRCHMTLELPWSADKAIQQFGRSHRSNQSSAPLYQILVTPCGGERRFASAAAKRLQSLGALLKGDRRALGAGVDLRAFDIDTKEGSAALNRLYDDAREKNSGPMPNVNVPGGDFKRFARFARRCLVSVGMGHANRAKGNAWELPKKFEGKVPLFLNRLMGLSVDQQKLLFAYFTETHEAEVAEAKARGTFDEGVVSLSAESVAMSEGYPRVVHTDVASGATTELCRITIDRGVTFARVLEKLAQFKRTCVDTGHDFADENGIWVSTKITAKERDEAKGGGAETSRPWILCATEIWRTHALGRRMFRIRRPYNSDSPSLAREHLVKNYRKLTPEELQAGGLGELTWRFWYNRGMEPCIHGERCRRRAHGGVCKVGRRVSAEYLLTGAVLPLWQTVAAITSARRDAGRNLRSVNANGAMASPTSPPMTAAAAQHLHNDRDKPKGVLRVVRTELDDGRLVLGLHLGKEDVEALEQRLKDAVETVRERRASQMEEDERLNSPMRRESGGLDDGSDGDGISEVEIELREPESSVCENRDPVTGCDRV